jgi:hypothetical protein
MIIVMTFLAVAASLVLAQSQGDPNAVTWRTYKDGSYSKAEQQEIRILNTSGDYQKYVRDLGPDRIAPDAKDIEWGKEVLVAIHIGKRNTGGFKVRVNGIKKVNPTTSQVSWSEFTPPKGVATTDAITSPWTLVRMTKNGTKLTFSGGVQDGTLPGGIKIIDLPSSGDCQCCDLCIRTYRNRLSWRPYFTGIDAPNIAPSTCVISSADEFASYVKNYQVSGIGFGDNVNWYRERLVAIHLGRKLTSGYGVAIDHVDLVDRSRVDVSYVEIQPSGRSLSANSSTGPFLVIKIPRLGGQVSFTKRTVNENQVFYPDSCGCECRGCSHGHW